MPAALDEIVGAIEDIAPLSLAYEWDNSGLLLRCGEDVSRVLVALDVTMEVAQKAEELNCDMILAHHPLMFEAKKRFDCRKTSDAVMMRLIKSGISLYAAHTSFDRADGGINDELAQKLGLEDIEVIADDLVRVGRFKAPLDKNELAERIKLALGIDTLKMSLSEIETIEKAAVVGGSGGEFIEAAKNAGAEALITGEAKHHHFIDAQAQGVLLIEAGHFSTERCFVDKAFISLQSRIDELQLNVGLFKADSVQSPYEYI